MDLNLYALSNWKCSIGNQNYSLQEGDPIRISVVNISEPPVVRMTAYWRRAYDVITFTVDGGKYC